MAYYNDQSWAAPGRQASWEQPQPPSRSGTESIESAGLRSANNLLIGAGSTVNSQDNGSAFVAQFDEVERAIENLSKSQKSPYPANGPFNNRRESMPVAPRPFPDHGFPRHHSVSEYDGPRSHSASNVQGFYQNQRQNYPRQNDADQMAQAKRRMAAQRERELRNYHQEQQYHRNVSGSKSDRSMSPNTMSEEDRRELIARQHRALYGDQSSMYNSSNNPTSSQDVRVNSSGAGRGPSPLAFDPFGMQSPNASNEGSVQMPSRDKDATGGAQEVRANSNSSPSNQNPAFSLFENAQQANRTSNSSPGGSPPRQGPKANGSGVAPIGTRPTANQGQPAGAPLSKRATTPLPSPLSYSYNANEQNNNSNTTSASLNPSSTITDKGPIWGSKNGVWGNTNQGVQASVWG